MNYIIIINYNKIMKNNIKIIFLKFLLIWFEFHFVTAKIEIGEDLATTLGKH